MKCVDCPDYKACRRQNDLRRKRHKCKKANEPFVQTKADRIRAMSDEELAEEIYRGISSDACDYCEHNPGFCDGTPCKDKTEMEIVLDWLRQPVKDGEDDGRT